MKARHRATKCDKVGHIWKFKDPETDRCARRRCRQARPAEELVELWEMVNHADQD